MSKNNLINLDDSVMAALDFFSQKPPKRLNLKKFSFPLVIGSGNAYNTALIIFSRQAKITATESNFEQLIKDYKSWIKKKDIREAVIISASGEKDSPREIKACQKVGLNTTLITCSPNSRAAKISDKIISYEKLPEPYTYNVSTYLAIIMGASGEKAKDIKEFIKQLKWPKKFSEYKAYSFILPDNFAAISPMLEIKQHELFGPHLSLRSFSYGEARHAKFVHKWDKELVISLGKNKYFGVPKSRWQINIPRQTGNALVMALTYYIIGKIQASKTPYFKKDIKDYCQEGPLAYGKRTPFPIIVE